MFRAFLERKIRRQILRASLLISGTAFIAIVALWYVDSLAGLAHPLRMFINNVHGGITAFAIQLTGGDVQSFNLSPAGAYVIEYQGGSDAVLLSAGYIGSALLGAFLFFLVCRAPQLTRAISIITGVFTIGFLGLFIRPDQSGDLLPILICVGLGAFMVLLGWKGKGDINQLRSRRSAVQIVMTIVSLMIAGHILLDLGYVLEAPASNGAGVITNTVAAFAEHAGMSVQLTALIWSAIAVVAMALAFHFSIVRTWRQIPKNDDIV